MLKIIMSINLGNRNCKQFSKITQFYTFNEGFIKKLQHPYLDCFVKKRS